MMPSHMFNILKISGRRHELEEFRRALEGFDPTYRDGIELFNPMCFNSLIELPFNETQTMINLERARIRLWGCGSNAAGVKLKESAHELRYSFTTADNVPKPVIDLMLKKFPNLKFELDFHNPRRGIKGVMRVHKGNAIFSEVDQFAKEKPNVA